MKVVVYAADRFACGHYRIIWPGEALAAQGMDVTVVRQGESSGLNGLKLRGKISTVQAPDCDVIVFQRPASRQMLEFIPFLRRKGIAVVVDIDDDLARIHPSNPAFAGMHPTTSPDYNWELVAECCKQASLVTVSTPALLPRYGAHGRARLVYNCVPSWYLGIPRDSDRATIGWAGAMHSHPDDLDAPAMALARLHREGHELRFVGPDEGVAKKLGVDLPEGAFTGNLNFDRWMPSIALRLGIGVAPLADTTFNAAKSWLKPLEYSAAGVPWVASDAPEYRRLARLCDAPLATKPKQWYSELRKLLDEPSRRADLSARVRETAAELTVERNAYMWAEAWQAALDLERKAAHR